MIHHDLRLLLFLKCSNFDIKSKCSHLQKFNLHWPKIIYKIINI
jgi:hypothetical protein